MRAAPKRGVILGYQGCGNKSSTAGLLHEDGGQQCHKIYGQGVGKNQKIVLDILAPLTSIIECDNQGGSL